MAGISKAFPGVVALDGVDFEVRAGEVHALLGENGAGKSTLVKIMTGVYEKDSGEMYVRGEKVEIRSPLDAQRLGIRIIHQEFTLINDMSVAENIFLDAMGSRMLSWVPYRRMRAESRELLKRLGLHHVSVDALVRDLSVAEQQIVEIARALREEAAVIIMDEPTAALTDAEVERLMDIIRQLRASGTGIVYISHKLDEVMAIADRATVLRDGRLVGTKPMAELTRDEIVRMMVGRPLTKLYVRNHKPTSEVALEVRDLSVPGRVHGASLVAHKGEVVGITGLMGAGQSELVRAIFGAVPRSGGEIKLHGRPVDIRSPQDAIRHGIALLTENRKEEGLVLLLSVVANSSLAALEKVSRFGFVDVAKERRQAADYVERLAIKTPSLDQEVDSLSGGNQQKVVLSKWLATDADVIIMAEPTRGIDVGAKAEVYALIDELAGQGKTILLVSSELPEVINLSDRIYVMHEGRIVAELDAANTSQEEIGHYATGGTRHESA
ncbi:MAG: D-xylose ABC transporter ATP-binding protein [Bacillota bacterium]|nr:MAG: D-xylose ABC transporter ATP-binding protein [Bacillota bacterium]